MFARPTGCQIRVTLPAIVVRLNNRDKKSRIIKEGRRKELTAGDLGRRSNARIFVSDHLTRETSEFLAATKEKLRNAGFVKFVWPSDGHVLVREYERGKVIKIEDGKHLLEIENAFQRESETHSIDGEGEEVIDGESTGNKEEENTTHRARQHPGSQGKTFLSKITIYRIIC